MPGFASYDQIINALTVNNKGQSIGVMKQSFASAVAGRFTTSYVGPTPMVFGTPLTATQVTQATVGVTPFTDPVSPATAHILSAGFSAVSTSGTILIYDLLARYPFNGTVTTGAFTTVALPARDNNGASDGLGVMAMVVNANATAVTGQTLTLNYTNSAGVAGRTSIANAFVGGGIQHRLVMDTPGWFVPLQVGDVGLRSIQSYTLSASATSTQLEIQLVRPLAYLPLSTQTGQYLERDMVLQTPRLPRLFPGFALQTALHTTVGTTGVIFGNIQTAEN
jgi:hypothetical protein